MLSLVVGVPKHRKKLENKEEVQMLDLGKKYFVAADDYSADEVARWANSHTMKVKDKAVSLSTCGKAYELDVQYNDKLTVEIKAGIVSLLEKGKRIGQVSYDLVMMETCVVVHPIIVS